MKIRLQKVSDDFKTNDKAQWLLTMFYGVYLKDKWSLDERFHQLQQWELMLDHKKSYLLMALQDNRRSKSFRTPVGFALCTPTDNDEIVILEGLFVIPEYQKKGIGEKLINEVKKDNEVHVQSFSESVGFYEKNGFRIIGHRDMDDTTEMTTASYYPEYNYEYIQPHPDTVRDAAHMAYLRNIELQA